MVLLRVCGWELTDLYHLPADSKVQLRDYTAEAGKNQKVVVGKYFALFTHTIADLHFHKNYFSKLWQLQRYQLAVESSKSDNMSY